MAAKKKTQHLTGEDCLVNVVFYVCVAGGLIALMPKVVYGAMLCPALASLGCLVVSYGGVVSAFNDFCTIRKTGKGIALTPLQSEERCDNRLFCGTMGLTALLLSNGAIIFYSLADRFFPSSTPSLYPDISRTAFAPAFIASIFNGLLLFVLFKIEARNKRLSAVPPESVVKMVATSSEGISNAVPSISKHWWTSTETKTEFQKLTK